MWLVHGSVLCSLGTTTTLRPVLSVIFFADYLPIIFFRRNIAYIFSYIFFRPSVRRKKKNRKIIGPKPPPDLPFLEGVLDRFFFADFFFVGILRIFSRTFFFLPTEMPRSPTRFMS